VRAFQASLRIEGLWQVGGKISVMLAGSRNQVKVYHRGGISWVREDYNDELKMAIRT